MGPHDWNLEAGISRPPPPYRAAAAHELDSFPTPTHSNPSPRPLASTPRPGLRICTLTAQEKKQRNLTYCSLALLYLCMTIAAFGVLEPSTEVYVLFMPLVCLFGIPVTLCILVGCVFGVPNLLLKERPRLRVAVQICEMLLYVGGCVVWYFVFQGQTWEEKWSFGVVVISGWFGAIPIGVLALVTLVWVEVRLIGSLCCTVRRRNRA
ncbi:hypothetical protein BDW02DRAFT_578429 [Decorospora gaudefroyi]|uniref:Uncharacterized protein n=1 Tax=Decorospora gaudefroyi TaxID=184978 RepID=A0A6A5KJK7_9PLEO|nr:hypothetical protein BDW02DRAFT_578429 [Decorospora gaudefroyi]